MSMCFTNSGKPQDVSTDKSATPTIIILTTLLATTSTALCILILIKIIKKISSTVRRTQESIIRSSFQNSENEEVIAVTEVDNATYENLNTTHGAPEDTYDTASHSVQESAVNSGEQDTCI
ncbi:uncharacterized protein LOC123528300 isoform X2 [Mercenaria mercenaria]|uniref:uncharacterized protein LOC123528300 isoform X2 n=1 Tax=Mercenaria mercenaria TaxID=6596 RepID=UPI00234E4DDC|nr:uncharacterized protein LOC123528300 isoform X2 [Mercenaria mercenaria]